MGAEGRETLTIWANCTGNGAWMFKILPSPPFFSELKDSVFISLFNIPADLTTIAAATVLLTPPQMLAAGRGGGASSKAQLLTLSLDLSSPFSSSL